MRTFQLKRLAGSVLILGALVAASVAAANPAGAQKRLPTTTTSTIQPPTTTIPVPSSVPLPTGFSVISNFPDNWQIKIAPSTQLGDAELLTGPTTGGPAILTVGDNGVLAFLRLVENSNYTIRYRNKIWIPSTASFITSPWVQFNFHTPTFDSLRPPSPQNLRVISRTATTVTVRWDAVATAVRYDFAVNNGTPTQTGVCLGVYCTPTDPLTATFARPPVGTSVTFNVTASRSPEPGCGAYCFPDNRFITSLPATITVGN